MKKQNNKKQNHTSHFAPHTSQKGITLIALIITIIVMLILVGVTINVALNGGVFETAETATKRTQLEADKETLYLEALAVYNEKAGQLDTTKLETNLSKLEWKDISTGNNLFMCTSPKGNRLKITVENRNIKIEENVENNENVPGNGNEDIVENWDNSQADLFIQENGTITGLSDLGKENLNNGQTEFIIPNEIDGQKIVAIGDEAFDECRELTEVTIPGTVTEIKFRAFASCSALNKLNLLEGLISIRRNAFYGCSSLTEVTIPSTVDNIEGLAFGYCENLRTIHVKGKTEEPVYYDSYTGGVGWSKYWNFYSNNAEVLWEG